MRVVTLNIRHGGGKRLPKILEYLQSQNADVIVLTEFKENANANALRSGLRAQGFIQSAGASVKPRANSVCIFSRVPFLPRTYPELAAQDRHRLISAHFDGFAIYGVYFPQREAKAALFEFLIKGQHRPTEAAHLVIGDFNTGLHKVDENGSTFHSTEHFAELQKAGLVDSWRSRNPEIREFSWFSNRGNGFRIDHVFSSQLADQAIKEVYYDPTPRESGVTVHSAFVVEYEG